MADENTPQGVTVYYLMDGTDRIHSGLMVGVENGTRVRFADGGWNPVESCFLTEEQCRIWHQMPPEEWKSNNSLVVRRLQALIDEIQDH